MDLGRKKLFALKIAATAASVAATATLVPVPGVGLAALLTINIGMVAGITVSMGVSVTGDTALTLGASVVSGLFASMGGRMILGEALKFIPVLGPVTGVLDASIAGAATYGLGHGFTEFLLWFYLQNHRMSQAEEIKAGFRYFGAKQDVKEMPLPEIT